MTDYEGIDFIYYELGPNIISADTINKKPTTEEWASLQTTELEEVAYLANKASGKYDKGIGNICGRIWRGPNKGKWLNGIDLDNEIAIKEFGLKEEENLIERHEDDPNSLHAYFVTDEPIQSKPLDRKYFDPKIQPAIEIKSGGNKIMYCYPSMHGTNLPDGTKVIKQWKFNRLVQPPYKSKKELEELIDKVCAKYNLDYLKNRTAKKIIREKNKIPEGTRHNSLLTKCNNLVWENIAAYKAGEITDDQLYVQFQKIAATCDPPHDEEDIQRIFNDSIQFVSEEEERKSEFAPNPFGEGGIYYQTNSFPLRWIGGDRDYKLVEKEQKNHTNGSGWYYHVNKTFLACKATEITKHGNPLSAMIELPQKYSIVFRGKEASGNFTLKHKTISEIVSRLKDGQALSEYGLDVAINAQIKGFEGAGLLKQNDDVEFTGFFLNNDGKIFTSNVEIKSKINKEELKTALQVLEDATKFYDGRLDLFSTIIKWGMIAPLSFILKYKDKFLKWLHLYGISNAGKSSTGRFALALDGNHKVNKRYIKSFNDVNTSAKFGDFISKTTFPQMINETNLSFNDNSRYLINDIKIAVIDLIARSKFTHSKASSATSFPALSPFILTSNSPPPNDSAYSRRIIDRNFPLSESHKEGSEEAKEFELFLVENLDKLAVIGDFRNYLIMNSPQTILDAINDNNLTPLDIGEKLLRSAYGFVDLEPSKWIEQILIQDQLEVSLVDIKQSIINTFELYINNCLKNYTGTRHFEEYTDNGVNHIPLTMQERLARVADNNLSPYIKNHRNGVIVIYRGILAELHKLGLTIDQLPNLRNFADNLEIGYKKYNGSWVAKGTVSEIAKVWGVGEFGESPIT